MFLHSCLFSLEPKHKYRSFSQSLNFHFGKVSYHIRLDLIHLILLLLLLLFYYLMLVFSLYITIHNSYEGCRNYWNLCHYNCKVQNSYLLICTKAIIIKLGFLFFAIFISFYRVFLKKSIYSLTGLCVYVRHGDPPSLSCLFLKPSGKCWSSESLLVPLL